jgi:amino acid adenylation domain-containing protein
MGNEVHVVAHARSGTQWGAAVTSHLTSIEELEVQSFTSICPRIGIHAAAEPDGVAVAGPAGRLTYGELTQRASALAGRLRAAGVGPGSCVGVFLERSPEFVVAACGVLWAGAAYLPIDTASPPDRVEFVLSDSGTSTVLTSTQQQPLLPAGRWRPLLVDERGPGADDPSAAPHAVEPEELAYVIYTSGSTGQPKGVELTHANLVNLIDWHVGAFGVTAQDRASQVASLGFDAAVWEIWPHLAAGAAVHLPDDTTRRSPQLLRDWLVAERITVAFAPTALAEQLIHLDWPAGTALRTLLTGADVLHRRPAADLPFRLVNNYGPTECTVVATSGAVAPDSADDGAGTPSIGRPIADTTALILDGELRPVPPHQPGELCLAGSLVGRGYRNDPELTADRFVTVPIEGRGTERVYRTGDQVRLLENGEIAYLGRLDSQVKIRGFRIEPAEIVASVNRFPGVAASAVVAGRGPDADAEPELVGYVVPTNGARPDAAGLRAFLSTRLPEYMIPARFVAVDGLPLTLNGKLDAAALPAPAPANLLPDPADGSGSTASGGAGGGSVQAQIAEMVRTLLKIPAVDVGENIFLLGGHSMLAMQLVLKIRQAFGVRLSLRQVFGEPTVAGLAAEVERQMPGSAEASR